MRQLIRDYENRPGEHCGSTAMRNLLRHYCGLRLSEAETFGVGSGLDFLLIEDESYQPAVLSFGRSLTLETDVAAAFGIDYREQIELDDDRAWEVVREEVRQGRPTMLSGDALYLNYRDFRVHFPSHRFVLLGFDDDEGTAWVADRIDAAPQLCSCDALRKSRNPPDFLSTHNLWGKFHGREVGRAPEEAYRAALELNAQRMLGHDGAQEAILTAQASGRPTEVATGLRGLREYRDRLTKWRHRDDSRQLAEYASQCIEKFGTGGGNFRTMYASFLRRARQVLPDVIDAELPELADASSQRWTTLSEHLWEVARGPGSDELWESCAHVVGEIVKLETRLFETLGTRMGL
jgi:hypothetical protein